MMMELRSGQSQQLLGWLSVPETLAYVGAHVRYAVRIGVIASVGARSATGPVRNEVTLRVEMFDPFNARPYLALKSEDTPLDVLRRIDSFTEPL